jgi:hypothetical protein
MIKNAAELLKNFIDREREALEGIEMPHMPTLGEGFEEITKAGISQKFSIPHQLGLSVVSGFVSIGDKQQPQQIDCMLVVGEGKQYGLTKNFIYPIDQVLCIVEVKKTLSKGDLLDSMNHLGAIRLAYRDYLNDQLEKGKIDRNLTSLRSHYSQISGLAAPATLADADRLPFNEGLLFYSLLQDHLAPATIILGFDGHRTEQGLREAFLDILEEHVGVQNKFGVPNLPSLILASEFSLVKANGLPYICKQSDNTWITIASVRRNPARMLLEIIWTKIGQNLGIEMPWNDGLEMESLSPVLAATPFAQNDQGGWKYDTFIVKEVTLRSRAEAAWKPAHLGAAATSAFTLLAAKGGRLAEGDRELDEYLIKEYGEQLKDVCAELVGSSYFMRDSGYLRPIHTVTMQIEHADGTSHVAHDRQKLDEWCKQNGFPTAYFSLIYME